MIPDQPYWAQAPGNINLEHWSSSCPVDRFRTGDFFDVLGNVWQWTETPIYPFHGFEIHPWYDDFSTPTFDTRHNLIKGGSWISTGNEATRDSRYAFRRHFFQHAGFRYVESSAPVVIHDDQYESDALAAQYCDAHYGPEHFGVPNFAVTCAGICLAADAGAHAWGMPSIWAAPWGGRPSSWPEADSNGSPAWISPPASSAWRPACRTRATCAMPFPRRGRSSPSTRSG